MTGPGSRTAISSCQTGRYWFPARSSSTDWVPRAADSRPQLCERFHFGSETHSRIDTRVVLSPGRHDLLTPVSLDDDRHHARDTPLDARRGPVHQGIQRLVLRDAFQCLDGWKMQFDRSLPARCERIMRRDPAGVRQFAAAVTGCLAIAASPQQRTVSSIAWLAMAA